MLVYHCLYLIKGLHNQLEGISSGNYDSGVLYVPSQVYICTFKMYACMIQLPHIQVNNTDAYIATSLVRIVMCVMCITI